MLSLHHLPPGLLVTLSAPLVTSLRSRPLPLLRFATGEVFAATPQLRCWLGRYHARTTESPSCDPLIRMGTEQHNVPAPSNPPNSTSVASPVL
ncbi:uncharacterized protein EI90DRAFT_1141747 [Cantharellus anzutake]|uniref:uncharacterized protein n=1 Tax=Cantharellus anzutake TaxID=1750568 RepID=UPI001905119B|nr:uncharacterized protein EI90DRAFT_1141747 [Cantharellus anzutake]KAF8330594.1 hypothetical protein EI90DRAFT_1141747 [Cantharellus anzutake]